MTVSKFHSLNARFSGKTTPTIPGLHRWPATFAEHFVEIDAMDWRLEIGGLVSQPRTFTLDALTHLSQVTQNRRLCFAEGWTYRSDWKGVPLRQVLAGLHPSGEAKYLYQWNAAGQFECLPLHIALEGQALLCHSEKGAPLSPLYGGPVRLLVFNRYAHKGLSQITKMELAAEPAPGFWEGRGYAAEGLIEPGQYYAFDLKNSRPQRDSNEITQY